MKINENFRKFEGAPYLFKAVQEKEDEYRKNNPDVKVISLGIGNTKLPLHAGIAEYIAGATAGLGRLEGFTEEQLEAGTQMVKDFTKQD